MMIQFKRPPPDYLCQLPHNAVYQALTGLY